MKKRHLFSLAAVLAAFCLPCSSVIHADNPAAVTLINPASMSAEDFIRQYLGTTVGTLSADGQMNSQFVWFSQVNETNALLISQSEAVFNQLTPVTRQTVLMACEAHRVQYPQFVQSANALLAAQAAAAQAPDPQPEEPAADLQQTPAPAQTLPVEPSASAASSQTPTRPQTPPAPADSAPTAPASSEQSASQTPSAPADSSAASSDAAAAASSAQPTQPTQPTQPSAPDQSQSAAPVSDSSSAENSEHSETPASSLQTPWPAVSPDSPQMTEPAVLDPASQTASSAAQPSAPAASVSDSTASVLSMGDLRLKPDESTGESDDSSADSTTDSTSQDSAEGSDAEDGQTESKDGTGSSSPDASAGQPDRTPQPEPVRPAIQPGAPTIQQGYERQPQADPAIPFNDDLRPQGLVFEDYTDPFDAQEEEVLHALAAKAGFEIFEAHPVTYIYENNGLKVSSGRILKLSQNQTSTSVLFQILACDQTGADLLFLSDDSCSYDEQTGLLNLAPAGQMHLVLDEQAQDAARTEEKTDEPQPEPETQPSETDSSLQEPQTPSDSTLSPVSGDEEPDSVEPETAVIDSSASSQSSAVSESAQSGSDTLQTSPASQFINRYCYQSGMLIRQANRSNYRQILNGYPSWAQLSSASKSEVNTYLLNMGAQTYQTLYRQANQIRLGLPLSTTPAASPQAPASGTNGTQSWRPSVNTASALDPLFWIGSAAASFEALLCLHSAKRRDSDLADLLDEQPDQPASDL